MNPTERETAAGVYSRTEQLLRLRHAAQDLTLVTRRKSRAVLDGAQRSQIRGRGMEFAEVRAYQAGDDIRTIDWRVTARTQTPHTKLFQEERERPVFVVVDQRSPMFFGSRRQFKSVLAAELASIIGWAALAHNDRVGALLFGDLEQRDTRARRGKHAVLELIHHLSEFNHRLQSPVPNPKGTRLVDVLTDLRRVAKPGSAVFVLSDFHDFTEACREPLATLTRHCEACLFHLFDPLERELPKRGALPVTDGRHKLSLDVSSLRFRQQFQSQFDRRLALLRETCHNGGITLISSSVATSADQLALETFTSRRGRSAGLGGNTR